MWSLERYSRLNRPNDLRRTWKGDLLEAGVDLATVQKMAGHASASTTGRYDRRDHLVQRKAAGQLLGPYGPLISRPQAGRLCPLRIGYLPWMTGLPSACLLAARVGAAEPLWSVGIDRVGRPAIARGGLGGRTHIERFDRFKRDQQDSSWVATLPNEYKWAWLTPDA
jgi:hypothetical protein